MACRFWTQFSKDPVSSSSSEVSGLRSGGPYAFGSYILGERRLALHYRYSLALATYHFGDLGLDHDSYMRALPGPDGGNGYPSFSDEPLAPFDGLKYDLEHFGNAFLRGDKEAIAALLKSAEQRKSKKGCALLP